MDIAFSWAMIKRLTFLFLILAPSICLADFEEITVTQRKVHGQTELCYSELRTKSSHCIAVHQVSRPLTSTDPNLKIQELVLTDVALVPAHGTEPVQFGSIVKWKGNGAGTLSISGPEGRIFALGRLENNDGKLSIKIDRFSDEKLSQQFDRAVLFGESDPMRLHVKTEIWLEDVLLPALKNYLEQPAGVTPKP
jgi:hypothetical protein